MAFYKMGCMGRYDFDKIADFAHQRFVEGMPLAAQIRAARSQKEKEEAALVSHMEVTPFCIRNFQVKCKYADRCAACHCANLLQKLAEMRLH